jgi:anti-sigma-K factor RskA
MRWARSRWRRRCSDVAGGDVHELAAGYVLDALEPAARATFAHHLASCTICKEELESLRQAAAALAYSAEAPAPPLELRARVLARLRAEGAGKVVPLWRTYALPASAGLAAAAACAAIGLGVWTSTLAGSLDRERAARRAEARALAIVAGPAAARFPLSGARGALIVTPERQAVLVVTGLPVAPRGKTYEAWVVTSTATRPAGLFAGGRDGSLVALEHPVPRRASVAVSVERAGGEQTLSGRMILKAETS